MPNERRHAFLSAKYRNVYNFYTVELSSRGIVGMLDS
jgi:hypothetical protein